MRPTSLWLLSCIVFAERLNVSFVGLWSRADGTTESMGVDDSNGELCTVFCSAIALNVGRSTPNSYIHASRDKLGAVAMQSGMARNGGFSYLDSDFCI
jgi:hypothetical protein